MIKNGYSLKKLLIYERESTSGGGVEREGERIPSRPHHGNLEPDAGHEPMNRKTMTRAKVEHLTD